MANYRTRTQINWQEPVVIQMALTGAQFSNTEPAEAELVLENGIWKYPRNAVGAGAVVIPTYNNANGQPTGPVRLAAWQGTFGAATTWSLFLRGNPTNTSGEPYPSGDAANYDEPAQLLATAAGVSDVSASYGLNGAGVGAPIIMPGQGLYLVTTGATNPFVRFFFSPLHYQGGLG